MMKRCAWLVVALLVWCAGSSPVSAQRAGGWSFNAQYAAVLPIGDATKSFADGLSWRGGMVDIERAASDHVSVGVSVGWHVLSEENTGSSVFPDGAISGTALRHVNAVPLMVTGTVSLGPSDGIQPWFGVGGGTVWVENRTEAGTITTEDTNWHRGAMGEVGLRIPRERGATITLGARYQHALAANGVERSYVTFSLGYLLGG